MNSGLQRRLERAKADVQRVDSALMNRGEILPTTLRRELQENHLPKLSCIRHWEHLIVAREQAWNGLVGLEGRAQEGKVPFGEAMVAFHVVRFLMMQAYLSATWSLADHLTGVCAKIVCPKCQTKDPRTPVQLVSGFLKRDKVDTPASLSEPLRLCFGWPIGISYALRNYFIHDGALNPEDPLTFFREETPDSGFMLTEDGWMTIENIARKYSVRPEQHRAVWPSDPTADLRPVLAACEQDLDEALGLLLGTATKMMMAEVAILLDED
ncbi:MAG TPA: hypothetical protein PKY30_08975 [Myxococcota bacterium]|nr:hypothetical protein [Myxococcota bacterium]HNH47158.1 hypothetical protein [Myxococcota bacterium]